MPALTRTAHRTVIRTLFAGLASCALAGCAKLQMGYNVLTYDAALADTANQMLLLNAVRASQHYPKSFTSVGQLIASPPVSGSVQSTFNFDTMIPGGLTTYNHNPSISANAGYTQFALGNLNAQVFMEAIRKPVNAKITKRSMRTRAGHASCCISSMSSISSRPKRASDSLISRERPDARR